MFTIQGIVDWYKAHISRRDVLIIVSIYALFFATRLFALEKLPIFSDEGIYVQWAHTAWKDASLRFVSLTDGRQPLQTWATIPFLKFFPEDRLFAGRLFAVFSGFYALTAVIVSGWGLFSKRIGFIAGLLYTLTPYFIFYDRIALVDSFVNGSTLWMFFFSVLLARTLRLDVALILGMVTGLAMLGKSSVRLYAGMMIFAFVLLVVKQSQGIFQSAIEYVKDVLHRRNDTFMRVMSFLVLYGVVMGIALTIYNVQRLSPYMHYVEMKNTTFVLTFPELIADPFAYFHHNITSIPYYIAVESGYALPFLALCGLWVMRKKHRALSVYYWIWIVLAIIPLSFIAKVLFPRYVLSLGGLLILPASYMLDSLRGKKILIGIVGVMVLVNGYMYGTFVTAPEKLPFPSIDKGQYIEGWTSGYGAEEIVQYARDNAEGKRVILVAQGDFGMSGDVLRTFIRDGEDMFVRAYWPLTDEKLQENQADVSTHKVFVVYSHCKESSYVGDVLADDICSTFESRKPLKEIKRYVKPGNKGAIYLFELLPESL